MGKGKKKEQKSKKEQKKMTVEYRENIWTVVLTDLRYFRKIFFIRDLAFLTLELDFLILRYLKID